MPVSDARDGVRCLRSWRACPLHPCSPSAPSPYPAASWKAPRSPARGRRGVLPRTKGDVRPGREGEGRASCPAGPWCPRAGSRKPWVLRSPRMQRGPKVRVWPQVRASERAASRRSRRAINSPRHLVPKPFPHQVCQLPCISYVIISLAAGMYVSGSEEQGIFLMKAFFH